MKKLLVIALAALLAAPWVQAAESDGEVRKIDKEQARITLRHGEIRNLDMPPMSMVFRVRNPAVLDTLAEGDRVKFTAEKIDGQYTVTTLKKVGAAAR
jgi:Cu(I)/Ag(I) efflux system protein CusF